jgi:NAD(P)-dependent dehydrogenase (short-subunit alcohol dehydrogenase family)
MSTATVLALTKRHAGSEGPNIRVNAVAPGPVWTPFWSKPGGFADTMAAFHKMPRREVEHEMSLRQLPLKRLGGQTRSPMYHFPRFRSRFVVT